MPVGDEPATDVPADADVSFVRSTVDDAGAAPEVSDGPMLTELDTRPIVELHLELQVAPRLRERVPSLSESQFTVYAMVPSTVVGMTIPQRREIHEFRNLREDAHQSKSVVVAPSLIGTDGYLKLMWVVNHADLMQGSILRQETLDAADERLESTLVLGDSSVLTGVVSCRSGERIAPLRLSVMTKGADITIRSVVTSARGEFALLVPQNSAGVVWPDLLGQVSEVAWSSGVHLEFDADFSSLLRVHVVDDAGAPVSRCRIVSANDSRREHDGSLRIDERLAIPSPDGVHLYSSAKLADGSLMFLVLPGPRQCLHRYREANREPDLSYRIMPDSLVPADASIRIVVVTPGGEDPTRGIEVALQGPPIDERRRFEYRLQPTSSDWRAQQIFAGTYDYEVFRDRVVVANGSITIEPRQEARLDLRI